MEVFILDKEEIEKKAEREGVKESAKEEFVDQVLTFNDVLYGVDINLDALTVAEGIIQHAKNSGGCLSCVHSRPDKKKITRMKEQNDRLTHSKVWQIRDCVLGLSHEDCSAYKPII